MSTRPSFLGTDARPLSLHDAMYRIAEEICWDSDYLYRFFTEHFCALMRGIYDQGAGTSRGGYRFSGIKSGLDCGLTWRLEHRIDFHGPNRLSVDVEITGRAAGNSARGDTLLFELGTGRALPGGEPA